MRRKDLGHLVWKLRSMHLVVPGAVAHIYHVQCVIDQAGAEMAWLYP